MTSEILPLAPAERPPCPVVRRRALQLALLLGGLLGLGLLFGGQAHADDTSGAASSGTLTSRHSVLGEAVARPARDVRAVREGVSGAVRTRNAEPARDQALQPALDTVRHVTAPVGALTKPVGALTEQVGALTKPVGALTGPVGDIAGQVIGGLASVAPRPQPDEPPALPGLPDLPELPVQPGHPAPAPTPSAPDPAPSTPAPPAATTAPTTPAGTVADRPSHAPAAAPAPHRPRTSAAHLAHSARAAGPTAYDAASAGRVDHDRRDGTHRGPAAQRTAAPQPGAPAAPRPDGTLGANASAGDGGPTRHSDLHAAAFGSRVPVLLLPGAFAPGVPAPVADRYRDIPEFPG
ncbi:hypothetical protein [Streptomyces sp. NPDC049813]|uniref:hypothetical protein n=1 Tax=Streptomyces sp. NPDC049813 TaxID=3365597 RepID=UPI0037A66DF9